MNEAHLRFHRWLAAGAEGDPPRDLAVHASVCPGCQQSIAALDLLTLIDPSFAGMPASVAFPDRGGLVRAGRLAGAAAGVMFSAVIIGIGASQLISLSRGGGPLAQASQTPAQGVLGSTATAQPSTQASSPSARETLTLLGTPTPSPRQTQRATPRPISATPSPTPTGAPSETPVPTATPMATPTVPEAPVLSASTDGIAQITLTWTTPADGGSPITGYDVYRDAGSGFSLYSPAWSISPFVDDLLPPGTYTYYVVAVNALGGTRSNDATGVSLP